MNDTQRLSRGYALDRLHDAVESCRMVGLRVKANNENGTLVLRIHPAWVVYNSNEESFVPEITEGQET